MFYESDASEQRLKRSSLGDPENSRALLNAKVRRGWTPTSRKPRPGASVADKVARLRKVDDENSDEHEQARVRDERATFDAMDRRTEARAAKESEKLGHDTAEAGRHLDYLHHIALNPGDEHDHKFQQRRATDDKKWQDSRKRSRERRADPGGRRGQDTRAWDNAAGGRRGRRYEDQEMTSLYDRVFTEAEGRPPAKDRNPEKFLRNVRRTAVALTKKNDPAKSTVSTRGMAGPATAPLTPLKGWREPASPPNARNPPRDIPGEDIPGHGDKSADWIAQRKVARTLRPLKKKRAPDPWAHGRIDMR